MSSGFSEDAGIFMDHEQLYSSGRKLRLSPHKPLPSYGSHLYPIPEGWTSTNMMRSEDEETFSLNRQVFDPRHAPRSSGNIQPDEGADMVVDIVRMIGGSPGPGYSPGPQKLLCRVANAPTTSSREQRHKMPIEGQMLFLKVYDALFWHKVIDVTERALNVPVQAGSAFSNEYGAYHFLYGHGLTGFDPIEFESTGYSPVAPQFSGGWTVKVGSVNPEFANKSRQVAILAIEYVDGVYMRDLFTEAGPMRGPVQLYQASPFDKKPAPASFNTDEERPTQSSNSDGAGWTISEVGSLLNGEAQNTGPTSRLCFTNGWLRRLVLCRTTRTIPFL
ncbi:hypothetical protein LY78DRAFT_711726 [Colletotrichum sublineola]|nr:hypothetical protein LY78DRAFT_711726 [Colletotrichum sublineola]